MSELRPFVKKDIAVQAERVTTENALALAIALNLNFLRTGGGQMLLQVGDQSAYVGDWIVQSPDSSLAVLDDAAFTAQYAAPEEATP